LTLGVLSYALFASQDTPGLARRRLDIDRSQAHLAIRTETVLIEWRAPVFRLSKLSDYAVVVLSELGRVHDGAVRTASGLAAATGIAEPTVAKVLKLLASNGLVTSQRGAMAGIASHAPCRRSRSRT
jgi:hypothetical protein